MSWSKLWQRGGRKEKKEAPAPAPTLAPGPETVTLAWVAADGGAHCEVAPFHSHGEGQIGVQLSQAIEPDTPVWLISADGFEHAGAVLACNVQQDRLIGHITLREPAGEAPEDTATRVQWIEPGGEAVACAASLAAKGDGRIRVSLPRALPASTVVRIAGREYQCLGVSDSCEQEGEGWVAEVEVISPSLRLPQRAAA